MIKELRKPFYSPADDPLHETTELLEERFAKVLRDIKDVKKDLTAVKEDLTNVKEDLNENRRYTTSKYHELRQDVNDISDNTNAKHHELRQDLTNTHAEVQLLRQSVNEGSKISGTTYIRWGRTICPANGSVVTYTGYAGGSWPQHTGGAASMLCLPENPDWEQGKYSDATESAVGYIYGAEYQGGYRRSHQLFKDNHYNQNVPCAVCNVRSRSSHIMIPGKTRCPAGWTREYYGYLMSGHYGQKAASDYYCIDMEPEDITGGEKNENGHPLYFVESHCVPLKCPPYVNGRELPCVVCTK